MSKGKLFSALLRWALLKRFKRKWVAAVWLVAALGGLAGLACLAVINFSAEVSMSDYSAQVVAYFGIFGFIMCVDRLWTVTKCIFMLIWSARIIPEGSYWHEWYIGNVTYTDQHGRSYTKTNVVLQDTDAANNNVVLNMLKIFIKVLLSIFAIAGIAIFSIICTLFRIITSVIALFAKKPGSVPSES